MKKLTGFIKKHPIKTFVLIPMFIVFAVVQYLNFTGFCYEQKRYITKDELLKIAGGEILEENPDCCEITDKYFADESSDDFLNKLFGRYHYGVTTYLKDYNDYPYYVSYIAINQCGKVIDYTGINATEEQYNSNIKFIRKAKEKNDE